MKSTIQLLVIPHDYGTPDICSPSLQIWPSADGSRARQGTGDRIPPRLQLPVAQAPGQQEPYPKKATAAGTPEVAKFS